VPAVLNGRLRQLTIVGAGHPPGGTKVRVRALQTHAESRREVGPGHRLAINLTGVAHHEVVRGNAVVRPGHWTATARFDTRSGWLTATRAGALVWLDFPREEAVAAPAPAALLAALDVKPLWTGRNRLDWLVEVESEAAVRALAPDLVRLRTVDARGVIVTSAAAGGAPGPDFVSRFFAPRAGIDEDPVTGSAHCALGPYWAARLGHADLTGYQASARGGRVAVRVGADRVAIGGRAVTVLRGLLTA
jgi:predicted PhzF superfamily epimerase YddE/YHI9